MSVWVKRAAFACLLSIMAANGSAAGQRYKLGAPATPEEVAGWDIDIRPDGKGLPSGQGNAEDGESLYIERCAACHGEFGEARGRYPVLMGGAGSLKSEDPVKTIGSYWPYATTVFDYLRRAMPFGHAQSLTNDENYAITAYLLYLNDIVQADSVIDAKTLPAIKMPNQAGFIPDDRPDVPLGEPCMKDCRKTPVIVGRARQIDVTPETERVTDEGTMPASASDKHVAGDPDKGKQIFAQCMGCHTVDAGVHRFGPSLNGIFGRTAGAAEGFKNYSAAMKAAGFQWSEETLREYLKSPQKVVAGTTMPFGGIKSKQQVDDLIAYLRRATAAP